MFNFPMYVSLRENILKKIDFLFKCQGSDSHFNQRISTITHVQLFPYLKTCVSKAVGEGGEHVDHTIMVYDLELFVGLFLLFFLPVCVFVTIFSVILRFLFNLFCTVLCSCSCFCFQFESETGKDERKLCHISK